MTNQDLKSTNKEILLEGAKHCADNAKRHYSSAQKIADIGNYGIAKSHLILSVEESIKCMVIVAGYFNIELQMDIRPIFRDHKAKHLQAFEIQSFIDFIYSIKLPIKQAIKTKKLNLKLSLMLATGLVLDSVLNRLFSKNKKEETKAWWTKANQQKNDGFYVDFKNNEWIIPESISEDDFLQSLNIAEPFIECVEIVHELKDTDHLLLS